MRWSMGRIRDFFSRDKPKNYIGDDVGTRGYYFGKSAAGKYVTPYNAVQLTAVYACIRVIAETVAALPLNLFRYTDMGKERAEEHPLYALLHDEPNPEMSSMTWRETMMHHVLTAGNAYSQIVRDGGGRVLELYPLLPNKMRVERSQETRRLRYIYSSDRDGQIVLSPDNVLHIPGLGFDGIIGYSPIAMCRNSIGLAMAAEDYGSSFFESGARPTGILEHPGKLKDPVKVREAWENTYGNGKHRTAVLEEGMKYQQIAINPEEAQFLETRKFQVNEICRIFRVPPHMVADLEKSSFSNIEQQSLDFVQNTITPWLVRIEQSMMRQLLLTHEKKSLTIKHNVNGLLRGDYSTRMSGYATGIANGWYTVNEIRELEDMNRIPAEEGGDLHLCQGAMTKLADAGRWNEGGAE